MHFGGQVVVLVVLAVAIAVSARRMVAHWSPGDAGHAGDESEWAWTYTPWTHFGSCSRGAVSGESWVDLHSPCGSPTDEDDDRADPTEDLAYLIRSFDFQSATPTALETFRADALSTQ